MSFEIKQATRRGVIPWIDLYSESGCGKTMSALLLARGLAGPGGKIGMVDTESRRGSLYADVIPGGYDVIDLEAPFTPARYIEAQQAFAKAGFAVVVVDSASHEWEGIGGILDMAGDNEAKSNKPGLHNWKTPKLEHAKWVQSMLRFPVPLICCVRAKYKTRQKKDAQGRTVIVKDEVTSPIQAEDFIFEATAHLEILPDHSIHLTKCSHPKLRECFPKQGPITVETGEKIAEWCRMAGGVTQPAAQAAAPKPAQGALLTTAPGDSTVRDLQRELWGLIPKEFTAKKRSWESADGWLLAKALIGDGESATKMTAEQLAYVIKKARELLSL